MSLHVMQLELKKWLPRPLLWTLWTLCFFLISLFFYRLCVDYLTLSQRAIMHQTTYPSMLLEIVKPLSSWSILLFSVLLPIFTTHALSQEYRQHTIILWANSTLSARHIIVGKFFGVLFFPLSLIIVESLMLLTLSWETHLDIGWLGGSALVILLVTANVTAFGLFVSSLSSIPLASITLTFLGLFLWMLLEWIDPFPHAWKHLAQHLSLLNHSYHLLNGVLLSTDVVYYVLFCVFWLYLAQYTLDKKMKKI